MGLGDGNPGAVIVPTNQPKPRFKSRRVWRVEKGSGAAVVFLAVSWSRYPLEGDVRRVVVCFIWAVGGAVIAVGSPAAADSLKSVVRTLNAIVNPEDAWRLEDQARRYHRPNEERYWRDYGAGLEQQRRERGEAVPPRGGWHGYSTPIGPDEAYRLQYQARRDGHVAEEHYWARYRQGLEEHGPRR